MQSGAKSKKQTLHDAMVSALGEMGVLFSERFNPNEIGAPGLSCQEAFEHKPAIPCFLSDGKLYTVIESREKNSSLNNDMREFLKGTSNPTQLLRQIKTGIGT